MKKEQQYEAILAKEPKNFVRNFIILLLIGVLIALCLPFLSFDKVSERGITIALNIIKRFFNPDWAALVSLAPKGIPYLLLETVCIALLGTVIGAILSFPLAFLASRNITGEKISSAVVVLITIVRTIPPFVYVLIFVQVEIGAVAGILAFAMTSIGMISKLFIETIEELDQGVIEALDSSGATTFQKIRYGIIPQLMSNFLSTILYRFEINVKNATILGMVGAGGVGAELMFAMGNFRWDDAATLLIGILILVLTIEYFSGKLRDKLIHG